MPKQQTILDQLARTLKARNHALDRFDRRTVFKVSPDPAFDLKSRREAFDLLDDLNSRAVWEYNRVMKSSDGRVKRDAIRMMPDELIEEYSQDYENW